MIDRMDGRAGLAAVAVACTLAVLALGGCAGTLPVNQEVAVRASEGGERVEASCEVSNDQARWAVVVPTTIGVTRSAKPLTVECRTPEGSIGTRVFEARREGALPGSPGGGYGYPATLEVVLMSADASRPAASRSQSSRAIPAEAPAYAPLFDVGRLPALGDEGRNGYRRFLAGDLPRAFAISDEGHWVRANGVNGASRVALERCRSYGSRCRLYAIDDQVVWDTTRAGEADTTY